MIGLSGTEGLSNLETLSPAGIYIRAPANHIKVRSSGIICNISFLIKDLRKIWNLLPGRSYTQHLLLGWAAINCACVGIL